MQVKTKRMFEVALKLDEQEANTLRNILSSIGRGTHMSTADNRAFSKKVAEQLSAALRTSYINEDDEEDDER